MHNVIEIALGVALGMAIFMIILWAVGYGVYICCGNNTKKIASVKKVKTYTTTPSEPETQV